MGTLPSFMNASNVFTFRLTPQSGQEWSVLRPGSNRAWAFPPNTRSETLRDTRRPGPGLLTLEK